MRPTDENQAASTRPNLMSSRRSAGEDNILAMLERDSARRNGTRVSSARLAWYGAAAALTGILAGGVAWLAYDNHQTVRELQAQYDAAAAAERVDGETIVTPVPGSPSASPCPGRHSRCPRRRRHRRRRASAHAHRAAAAGDAARARSGGRQAGSAGAGKSRTGRGRHRARARGGGPRRQPPWSRNRPP
ncbi:hypothetical protein [Massilia sp. Se16.2.3]|uniref:hypothetical protein n=1 Tax=Massilia sp. Se16.2.3 TaxID=2709303 RepID=UPI0015FFB66E|nr:hypothetical protein [Massilia sp. Se16.2.3]QNA99652.1 hypothetical protein G4G31_13715 [Massilia sp. Se16.2.3]